MNQQLHIAATTNTKFLEPLQVCLLSVLQNNSASAIKFSIIDDHLSPANRRSFDILLDNFDNCDEITFLTPNEKSYMPAITDNRIPSAAYYRLDLPQMLPHSNRLLYLDCDMICEKSLVPLWKNNLVGKVVGAVEDAGYVSRLAEMGVTCRDHTYFNSGLLLIDMQAWRAQHITEQARRFIHDHGEQLVYHDQDVLNAVLADNWCYLHPRFNVQSRLVRKEQINPQPARERLAEAARQLPTMIHYSGRSKPWLGEDDGVRLHPWRRVYQEYAAELQRLRRNDASHRWLAYAKEE
ncbi:glycosyltransferase family 8 protein [Furfurilactobacillus entadae]|uniref:glycosyltransferase family 8 protein n=1 Tax=Furfurilactobacillus entadae TaxID=2922307 RepID=UPI0035EEEA49